MPDESRQNSLHGSLATPWGIFLFWIPLGLMWIFMAVEQPAMSAVIARLPEETVNLAAFGVAFSLALAVESPILQLLSASTALSTGRDRYRTLLRFMHIVGALITVLHLVLAASPLFSILARNVLEVPPEVVEPARSGFLLMVPFAATVGYRRLWQGMLIRYGKTRLIPITVAARLIGTVAVLLWGYVTEAMPGAQLAGLALIVGTTAGAVSSYLFVHRIVRHEMPGEAPDGPLSARQLVSFYVPLSLTSIIYLSAQPLLTFAIARSYLPLPSLAVWPVIKAYLFLYNSLALSTQEVIVTVKARSDGSLPAARRMLTGLGAALTGLFALTAFTPPADLWFSAVSGLSDALMPFTNAPLLVLIAAPALLTVKSWYRGVLIAEHRTGVLARAVTLHTVVLFALAWVGPMLFPEIPGATLASAALVVSLAIEAVYLHLEAARNSKRLVVAEAAAEAEAEAR